MRQDSQRLPLVPRAKQARYEAGETSTALAAEYGVTKSMILSTIRSNSVVVRRQRFKAAGVVVRPTRRV